ncbi:MAG TPA: hypothetical protein VJV05_15630 [Pyrinomonadaceae bacterium]|nr:hypothetical protein [Pyrinomonadaceae bacterium]
MKVDMSPEAVGARLRMVDKLWSVSVDLINSIPTEGEPSIKRHSRAAEIVNAIRDVFYEDWDPLGVNDYPSTNGEYYGYIGRVYRLLVGSRSEGDLIDTLREVERDEMGAGPSSHEKLHAVANKLLGLNVVLD